MAIVTPHILIVVGTRIAPAFRIRTSLVLAVVVLLVAGGGVWTNLVLHGRPVKGVYELPKVMCGECPNEAFIPFDDAAVVGHLTGRHVTGVCRFGTRPAGFWRWISTRARGWRT